MKRSPFSFFRYLLPTALDAWILATILLWLLAFIGACLLDSGRPEFDGIDLRMPVAAGAAAIILALGVSMTFRRVSAKQFAMFAFTIAGAIGLTAFAGDWIDLAFHPGFYGYQKPSAPTVMDYVDAYWPILVGAFAFAIGCMVGSALIRRLLVSVGVPATLWSLVKKHRVRIMIGFVAIMLPAVVLRNLLDPDNHSARFTSLFVISSLGLATAWAALFVVTKFVGRFRSVSVALFVITILCAAFLSLQIACQSIAGPRLEGMGSIVAAVMGPLVFLLALASAIVLNEPASGVAVRSLSVWSVLLPVFLLGGITLAWNRYDPRVVIVELVMNRGSVFDGDWRQKAIESRRLSNATGGAGSFIQAYGQGVVYFRIRGEEHANCPHVFQQEYPEFAGSIIVENIQPYVDTQPLSAYKSWFAFVDGELTEKHLSDICTNATGLGINGLRLPIANPKAVSLKMLVVDGKETPERFPEFLDAYVPTGLTSANVMCPLGDKDWDAIVRHQKACSFYVFSSAPPDRVIDLSLDQSLDKIVVYSSEVPANARAKKQRLESSINFSGLESSDSQFAWDLVFLSRGSKSMNLPPIPNRTASFDEFARQVHWTYGRNQKGDVTHAWLPDATYAAEYPKELRALTTLRLDREGLVGISENPNSENDLSPLKSLINLERLYLNRGKPLDSLAFLSSMPKLKHIQVHAQVRSAMPGSGYGVCSNLESVRFFGTVDPITIAELGKLKKLKRIEIVDEDLGYQDENAVAKLRAKFPNAQITIMHPEKYVPDLSEKWKQHVKRVRKEVIARLDKQIGVEANSD